MPASRLIILSVAVAAAGGAGYVAKNMVVAPPPQIVVDAGPQTPAVALQDVLVLSGDVMMGNALEKNITWQSWPADGLNPNFITKATAPDALEKLKEEQAGLEGRLSNASFVERAAPDVVATARARVVELKDQIARLEAIIESL